VLVLLCCLNLAMTANLVWRVRSLPPLPCDIRIDRDL
jgi:hypothetical protein